MKVYVGSDHRGCVYKSKIVSVLEDLQLDIIDVGTHHSEKSCDYPKVAYSLGTKVASVRGARGILVCMSGIGQTMAANKVVGCFAALCYNVEATVLSRQHNDANILVIGSKFVKAKDLRKIITVFLNTEFEGGRHKRRVNQMKKIEKGMAI